MEEEEEDSCPGWGWQFNKGTGLYASTRTPVCVCTCTHSLLPVLLLLCESRARARAMVITILPREKERQVERERGECIRMRYYNAPESRLIDCDFGEGYKGFLYRENNGGSCVVLCARKRDLRRGSKAGRENSKCELRKIIGAFRGKCPEFKAICKGMNGGGIGFRFEWFIHIRCNKGSLREL